MKFLYKLVILLIIFSLQSCNKNDKEISIIKEVNQELEMISAYAEGIKYLNEEDNYNASKKFLEAELLFPQSDWAPKSALMAAYAYYLDDYYVHHYVGYPYLLDYDHYDYDHYDHYDYYDHYDLYNVPLRMMV